MKRKRRLNALGTARRRARLSMREVAAQYRPPVSIQFLSQLEGQPEPTREARRKYAEALSRAIRLRHELAIVAELALMKALEAPPGAVRELKGLHAAELDAELGVATRGCAG